VRMLWCGALSDLNWEKKSAQQCRRWLDGLSPDYSNLQGSSTA
jgi:hypothetical protein